MANSGWQESEIRSQKSEIGGQRGARGPLTWEGGTRGVLACALPLSLPFLVEHAYQTMDLMARTSGHTGLRVSAHAGDVRALHARAGTDPRGDGARNPVPGEHAADVQGVT